MTNRVHIDAPAGVIDIEGEKDFVEGLLSKLFPLIEEAGFGSRPQEQVKDQEAADDEEPDAARTDDESGNAAKAKPKGNPPHG